MSYYGAATNPFLAPVPAPLPKRNVFISSFHGDRAEVDGFIYRWATEERVFTPKALCTFDNDDFIDSDSPEYVMGEIRRKYLQDASVTILLIGKCTHSRRYVDWEIKSSLRRGQSLGKQGTAHFDCRLMHENRANENGGSGGTRT